MAKVLIIDDDRSIGDIMSQLVNQMGHDAVCAYTLKAGLDEVLSNLYDVVLLDLHLPDGSGLEILPQIRRTPSAPEVIIITGFGDKESAEIAIKSGAWDYIQKTDSPQKITLPLNRVLQYRASLRKIQQIPVALKRQNIIGDSHRLAACLDAVAQAAGTDANILITGETGTGKEIFARALYANSRLTDNKFVVVDCAALPETLIESSLFGHEKGAFTGADRTDDGLIKQADGGTLFLDEVGELSLKIQKTFLRVLQERRYRRVGGKKEITSNFRLISATNKDLDRMVKSGRFRKDLLYRLKTISIELPPLREHLEDIKPLAVHYIMKICDKYGMETKGFSADFIDVLQTYTWPGNVRELINVLEETITAAAQEAILFSQHLSAYIRIHAATALMEPRSKPPDMDSACGETNGLAGVSKYRVFRETVLADQEKQYFKDLMRAARGDIQKACRLSGLSRSGLYAILKRFNLSSPVRPSD